MKVFLNDLKKNWIAHLIFILAFLLCLCVYPLEWIGSSEYVSASTDEQLKPYIRLDNETLFTGTFKPSHEHLDTISIKFNTKETQIVDGTLLFLLYDPEGEVIAQQTVGCTEIKNNDYQEFEINAELETSEEYQYTLETFDSSEGVPFIMGGSDAIGPKESGEFLFSEEEELEKRIPVRYKYTVAAAGKTVLVYDICILTGALLLLFATRRKDQGMAVLPDGGIYRYVCFLAICVMLIFIADESKKPLRIDGCNLKHDVGAAEWEYLVIGDGSGYSGAWASMDTYMLNAGDYYIGAAYSVQEGTNKLVVIDNGKVIVERYLPKSQDYIEIPFTLEHDSQEVVIQYWYGGEGYFYAHSLSLHSKTGFYQDAGYYAVMLCLISSAVAGYILFQRKRMMRMSAVEKEAAKKKSAVAVILTMISLFSFLPYLHGGLPWGDDLCYHLIRIEGIKDGMRDGQFPVILYPEGMRGYGYLNCMYPYLFLYIPAIIRLFGVSLAASYKTLIFLFGFLTAFITYHCTKSMYPSVKAALTAALLYTCCAYRYTNIYARGAVGEALAMTFLPLLAAGLYHVLAGDRKKWWMLALGMTGLLQTHILSVALGGALCVIAGILFLSRVWKERRFIEIGKAALMTVLLNLWFLVPFLHYYSEGDLWTSTLNYSTYSEWSVKLSGIAGANIAGDYRSLSLGIPVVCCAGIAIFWLLTRGCTEQTEEDRDRRRFLKILTVLGFVCIFLLSGQFGAWEFMKLPVFESLFSTIQFPWRLFGLSSVFFIMAGCIALFDCPYLSRYARSTAVALCAVCMVTAVRYKEDDFAYKEYTDLYTEGHQSKVIGVPKGAKTIVYPYEWRREGLTDDVLIAEAIRVTDTDEVTVSSYWRSGTTTSISYRSDSDSETIVLPVQLYDGYHAEDEEGRTVEIEPSEDQLVSFTVNGDGRKHTVRISFRQNPAFIIATVVSILAAVFYACRYPVRVVVCRLQRRTKKVRSANLEGEQDAADI